MNTLLRGLLVATCAIWVGSLWAADDKQTENDLYQGQGLGYEQIEQGYFCSPMETAYGLICTDNRSSAIYMLQDGKLQTIATGRGIGRYTQLNSAKTMLALKLINDYGEQAPAVLDLRTQEVKPLHAYVDQCGQPTFGSEDQIAYTIGNVLCLRKGSEGFNSENGLKKIELGFYANTIAISRDGKHIALTDNEQHPLLLSLADGQITVLSELTGFYEPQWSPEGNHLLFQRNNQQLYCWEAESHRMFCVGKGHSAIWLNDEELAFTRSEYLNDDVFFFQGASLCRARFDGTSTQLFITSSSECPQDIALLKNGNLAIAYSAGDRRISEFNMAAPEKETSLHTPAINQTIGTFFPPMQLSPIAAPAAAKVGIDDIPYINQKHDVPAYRGSYGYGPCACAPSTACMLLGYYKQLPHDNPVNSRAPGKPWGKQVYYSWYVGTNYTSPLTNYVFDREASSSCDPGRFASGGYGYMWRYGSPHTEMANFYKHNGAEKAIQDYSGASTILTECNFGRPYSWCVTSTLTDGHLILPFLGNSMCVQDGTNFSVVQKGGCVVVHDPYGNANRPNGVAWGGSDGRHVTYDFEGYNNGNLVMRNAWGISVWRGQEVPDAIEEVTTQPAAEKVIENGQLILIKDGVRYSALGVRL